MPFFSWKKKILFEEQQEKRCFCSSNKGKKRVFSVEKKNIFVQNQVNLFFPRPGMKHFFSFVEKKKLFFKKKKSNLALYKK